MRNVPVGVKLERVLESRVWEFKCGQSSGACLVKDGYLVGLLTGDTLVNL